MKRLPNLYKFILKIVLIYLHCKWIHDIGCFWKWQTRWSGREFIHRTLKQFRKWAERGLAFTEIQEKGQRESLILSEATRSRGREYISFLKACTSSRVKKGSYTAIEIFPIWVKRRRAWRNEVLYANDWLRYINEQAKLLMINVKQINGYKG